MEVKKALHHLIILMALLPFWIYAQHKTPDKLYVLKDSIALSSIPSDRVNYVETYLHRGDSLKVIPNEKAQTWQNKAILSEKLPSCNNYFELGQFVLVEKDSILGYVFDKYLSSINPNTFNSAHKYDTKKKIDTIVFEKKQFFVNKDVAQLQNSIKYERFNSDGCQNQTYYFPKKTSIATILMIAELLYPDYTIGVDQLQMINQELQLQLKLNSKELLEESIFSLLIGIDMEHQTFRLEQYFCD